MTDTRDAVAATGAVVRSTEPDCSSGVELIWPAKVAPTTGDAPIDSTECRTVLSTLRQVGASSTDATPLGHLLYGDALDALEALARTGDTSVRRPRLCYIDPPFNTGERSRRYDDSIDRSEWLSMMRDRLAAAAQLLDPSGSIWLHIDDGEQHRARCLLDEIFGADAFVATVIWQKRTTRDSRRAFSSMHDYLHVYAPGGAVAWKKRRNALPDSGGFSNPDADPKGPWRSVPMTAPAGHATPQQFYDVITPTGRSHRPPVGRCWSYSAERLAQLDQEGRIYWPKGGDGKPRLKRYECDVEGVAPFTLWMADDVGDNARAKRELLDLFDGQLAFDTPKPESLLQRIIQIATDVGDTVLDFFAGSGTTLAAAHKMQRNWIGVERDFETLTECLIPRLTAVLEGDDPTGITSNQSWSGGGRFRISAVERPEPDQLD